MTIRTSIFSLLLLFLLVSFPRVGHSLDSVEFEHINRSSGMPSNSVTSILQDKYGMMWFGTYNGLVRFNGYDYKVFIHNPSDSTSLSDNFVNSLELSKDGRLLVGHRNHGFSIFNYETEKFKRFTHATDGTNSLSSDHLYDLLCDKKGNIWIGTKEGLDKFDCQTGRFKHYKIATNSPKISEQSLVSSMIEDSDGQLLLFVSGRKIVRFDPSSESYTTLNVPIPNSRKMRINKGGTIFKDKEGFLWIGTEQDGIIRFNEQTGESVFYNTSNSGMTSNVIMHFMQDSHGKIWISTDGGGLMEFNHSSNKITIHRYNLKNPTSISSNAVYFVLEDRTGHLWIATYAAGINIIKKNKKRFQLYTNNGPAHTSLSYKSVLSFADAGNGKVWVGTDGGGLNLFDPKSKTFEWLKKENSGICSNIIKSLMVDDFGNLWAGTYASGLCKINFAKREFKNFQPTDSASPTTVIGMNIWAFGKAANGNLWIGELNEGIDFYNASTQTFEHYLFKDKSDGIVREGSIMSILVDKKGKVWIGTETLGIQIFDPETKTLKTIKSELGNTNGLLSNNIQTLIQDSDGFIWIGTKQGGVTKLVDLENHKFVNYTTKNGLAGSTVFGIVEDKNKNFWISTDNGISMLDTKTNTFHSFDKSDGLQSLEFSMNAAFKDRDGYIYFGGTDGFNRFHPDSIVYNDHRPSVFMSGFKLFNKSIEANVRDNGKVYLTKPIHLLDTIVLDYTDYVFSIEFSAIDYTTPERNQFAYRLEGLENEWNYVDASKRIATYTNLSPGEYTFHVKASNNDGVWNEQGRTILIIVLPPWWQTWWFQAIAAIVIVLSLIAFFYLRLRSIKERNIVLYKLVKQKTSELEGKNIELLQSNNTKDKLFSIIGHDLRNPVSALSALTDMLQTNYHLLGDKDKHHIVEHIQASSTSLKLLVNNLLDWALVQSKHLDPHPTIVEIRKASEECFKLVKLLAHSKNITLENDCAEHHYVFSDPNMFHTILRNLISNAIKFTPKEGKVKIASKELENDTIQLIISDTGAGMSQQKIDQILANQKLVSTTGTSDEKGSGLGLVVVKEFIEANKGKLQIKSSLGQGTSFLIELPMMHTFE